MKIKNIYYISLVLGIVLGHNKTSASVQSAAELSTEKPPFNFQELPHDVQIDIIRKCPPDTIKNFRNISSHYAKNKDFLRIHINQLPSFTPFIKNFPQLSEGEKILPYINRVILSRAHKKDILFLSSLPNLQVLDLSYSFISSKFYHQLNIKKVEVFINILSSCSKLRILKLNHNCFGEEGIGLVTLSLQHLPLLEVLELKGNCIGNIYGSKYLNTAGITLLITAFPHLPQLHTLTLEGNKIDEQGAKDLVKGLHYLKNLRVLKLWHNELGDKGAAAIASTFSSLPHLKVVRLFLGSGGKIGKVSTSALKSIREGYPQIDIC